MNKEETPWIVFQRDRIDLKYWCLYSNDSENSTNRFDNLFDSKISKNNRNIYFWCFYTQCNVIVEIEVWYLWKRLWFRENTHKIYKLLRVQWNKCEMLLENIELIIDWKQHIWEILLQLNSIWNIITYNNICYTRITIW